MKPSPDRRRQNWTHRLAVTAKLRSPSRPPLPLAVVDDGSAGLGVVLVQRHGTRPSVISFTERRKGGDLLSGNVSAGPATLSLAFPPPRLPLMPGSSAYAAEFRWCTCPVCCYANSCSLKRITPTSQELTTEAL